jgi:hypothetical protein
MLPLEVTLHVKLLGEVILGTVLGPQVGGGLF